MKPTEQEIKQQYLEHHNRGMSQADYDAFVKFSEMFEYEYTSYLDGMDKAIKGIKRLDELEQMIRQLRNFGPGDDYGVN